MKHTRLIPIIIVAIMLFNCIMPLASVTATTATGSKIQLNSKLYTAIEKQLEEQGILATCNDLKRTITISDEELAKVTVLDLSEKGISDLTGLDAFSSLKELDLSSNELTKESNLKVLSGLNLVKLDLSTNKIEDVSEITNLDSITEVNLHNQKFTQVEVITLDTSKTADNQLIVSKELPKILVEAGVLDPEWLIATKSYPGNHDELNFVWTGFDNDLTDGPSSVDIKVGNIDDDENYKMHKGLLKLNIKVKDTTNPLSESDINLYYLVIDSTQRAAVFKDAKLYNKVKEQLTQSTEDEIYNDYNEDLRTYVDVEKLEDGEDIVFGETLYLNAYDEPMILTFDINTLINEIPTLKVSNLQVEDISGIETFIGLEDNLDLSYNYIKTIEKIVELQNNKNSEEEKLQARFNDELSILKEKRTKLTETMKKIEEVDTKIATVEAEDHKAWTVIDTLRKEYGKDGEDYTKNEEYLKRAESYLKIVDETANKKTDLRNQRDELVKEADRLLGFVKDSLSDLYKIYNKEYKATTILTLQLNNMSEEEFYKLTYENAKNLYKAQIDRIANLEKTKSLSEVDKEALEKMLKDCPKMNENGIIENPISTELLKRYEENQENWTLASYRTMIKEFIELDVKLKLMNYMSIATMSGDYSEIESIIEYFENSIEENENKLRTKTEAEYYEAFNKDLLDKGLSAEEKIMVEYIYKAEELADKNAKNVTSMEPSVNETQKDHSYALSFILGLSGKFVNLTEEEVKNYVTLPDLKKLNLKNNMIEDLAQMEVLTELKELNISENEIINIDNVDWAKISKLKVLNLNHNFISNIEKLESLKQLEELYLSDNLLEGRFTFKLASMPNLKVADFSVNRYTDISILVDQYEFIAKDKEMTVSEYLASEDTIEIILYNQLLEINAGKFIVKEGEQQVETVKLPAIITQLKELDPTNTVYETVSILGKVRNDGTVGLIISKEEGKHTGVVSVDSLDRISMGHGTICVINYEVMNSRVDGVEVGNENTEQQTIEVELGKTMQFNAGVNGTNVEDTSVTWTVEGATSENTKIDANGVLTIGEDEVPGTEITVKATSNYDNTISGEVKVKVVKLNTNVAITPDTSENGLEQGATKQYSTVVTTEAEDKSVVWTVEGATSENTKIDANGVLTIGEDEVIGTKITVKATSNYDDTKFAIVEEIIVKQELTVSVSRKESSTVKGLQPGAITEYKVDVQAVSGKEVKDASIIWTVEGATSNNTTIDSNGVLTIGRDEIVGTKIIVKATSSYDNTKFATVEEEIIKHDVAVVINNAASSEGIEQGATKEYSATVTTEAEDKSVTWTVEGATSVSTKIENGVLTIGEDEIAGTKITVKVISNYDNTKSASVIETVLEAKVELNKPTVDTTVFEQIPGTNVNTFVNGLVDSENTVKVLTANGIEVESTEKLATGMKVVINDKTEYTIVVTGDINSDGKVDSLDSEMIKAYRLGSLSLTDVQKQAADINADGKVNRIDSFIMLLYRAGSREVRDFTTETIENIMK